MDPILIEGLRTVFIVGVPVVVGVAVAGLIVAALQSATTVVEPALSYAVRLVTVVVLGYLCLPMFIEAVSALALRAWR